MVGPDLLTFDSILRSSKDFSKCLYFRQVSGR